jgi:hypothetical protein
MQLFLRGTAGSNNDNFSRIPSTLPYDVLPANAIEAGLGGKRLNTSAFQEGPNEEYCIKVNNAILAVKVTCARERKRCRTALDQCPKNSRNPTNEYPAVVPIKVTNSRCRDFSYMYCTKGQ